MVFLTSRLKENLTSFPPFILIKDGKNQHQPSGRSGPLPPKGVGLARPVVAGTTEHLTHRPPVLGVLPEAHGASPQRANFITNIDWITPFQTGQPCPITPARL